MDTCTKCSAPSDCTGCIFSCFLSYIHFKLPMILHTKTASNIQKKKAIISPQVTTSQFLQSLPEIRNSQKGNWWELQFVYREVGTSRSKTAGSIYDLQNISTWALSPGAGYTVRVRTHLSPGSPKMLFLPGGNWSLKVAHASLTGRLN